VCTSIYVYHAGIILELKTQLGQNVNQSLCYLNYSHIKNSPSMFDEDRNFLFSMDIVLSSCIWY